MWEQLRGSQSRYKEARWRVKSQGVGCSGQGSRER